jgi:hypothetical protein
LSVMTESTCHGRAHKKDIAIALVSQVWTQVCAKSARHAAEPTAVITLKSHKRGRKSGAYRLEGLEPPVVAKRCRRETALVEQQVYEHVLPATGLPALTFYGGIEDPVDPDYRWLFVEDGGLIKPMESDRGLVAQWLARLHVSCAARVDSVALPERGPSEYLEHLRAARGNVDQCLREIELSAAERMTLEQVRRGLDQIEAQWDAICQPAGALPRTLVHGDLARKNCRLHVTPGGPSVVMLDWETAGWGPPAADLKAWARPPRTTVGGWEGTVPLDVYAAAVATDWPGVTLQDVEQQSRMGTVFRLLAGIRWASELLNVGVTVKGVAKLACLYEGLREINTAPH